MNNFFISEEEFIDRYIRQVIPYEGFVIGKGYAYFWYDTYFPTTHNSGGQMFWDRYTPTVLVQNINSSDYMIERSLNVSPVDISKMLMRTNLDGTMTVSLGINKEVTLSKEHGKFQVTIEDTGSEVNVHVAISDIKYENGVKKEFMSTQSCRLKDFSHFFSPVSQSFYPIRTEFPYLPSLIDIGNLNVGGASTLFANHAQYWKYNELWHKTKTKGVSWRFQSRWNKPMSKTYRNIQIKPLQGARAAERAAGKILRPAGGALIVADVALSGEIRLSHGINGLMIGLSLTGWGSVVAGIWFIADFGIMGVNYILGNEARGLGDIIDDATFGGAIIELYEGLY